MGKDKVTTRWLGNMAFEGDVDGHKIVIYALPAAGGENRGARPKPLMLLALAGCTGMDVVSMLKKMRVDFQDLRIIVEGDITEDYPKHYHSMHVVYEISGKNIPEDKVRKVVELSEEKYCGVSAVYKKYVKMSSEIRIMET
ncbi:MAG: OsmC family protein [Bacteroidales bacterium]|nr:OsmC family protein [Bacteroidales bacterium]